MSIRYTAYTHYWFIPLLNQLVKKPLAVGASMPKSVCMENAHQWPHCSKHWSSPTADRNLHDRYRWGQHRARRRWLPRTEIKIANYNHIRNYCHFKCEYIRISMQIDNFILIMVPIVVVRQSSLEHFPFPDCRNVITLFKPVVKETL